VSRSQAIPGGPSRPQFRYVTLPSPDFRLELSPQEVPFLSAVSRVGVAFSVFFGLLAAVSLPFQTTPALRAVDLMAVAVSGLLFLSATVGTRLALRVLNQALAQDESSAS
jgi:hypothetical protein